jgi:SAM-dependent methyltransferase
LKPARQILPLISTLLIFAFAPGAILAEQAKEPFKPFYGMPGRDAVWVPSPDSTVELMLDIAKITPDDFVIDLGSGDGRTVIAAARRGARSLGVEYNEKLVVLSRQLAEEAGVADKAKFVQGDMYVADVSEANALVLFLLTQNLDKLVPNFMKMKPGSRIVVNTFKISGWEPDYSQKVENCTQWCTVDMYIVPANASGTWKMDDATLTLEQTFQQLTGGLSRNGNRSQVSNGRLNGDRISFSINGTLYEGQVKGDRIDGKVEGEPARTWTAQREPGTTQAIIPPARDSN